MVVFVSVKLAPVMGRSLPCPAKFAIGRSPHPSRLGIDIVGCRIEVVVAISLPCHARRSSTFIPNRTGCSRRAIRAIRPFVPLAPAAPLMLVTGAPQTPTRFGVNIAVGRIEVVVAIHSRAHARAPAPSYQTEPGAPLAPFVPFVPFVPLAPAAPLMLVTGAPQTPPALV